MKQNKNIYYVYALVSSLDNKPFYIGKGKGRRMNCHLEFYFRCEKLSKEEFNSKKRINKKKFYKIRKILKNGGYIIYKKIISNLSDEKALRVEKNIIKIIGLKNLCNLTNGGEGISGFK